MEPKDRRGLVEAALGERPFDLLIQNVQLVNVFTGEIYAADVGIYDGFIAHVEANPDQETSEKATLLATEVYDGQGQFLAPGFVDSHVHVESGMMTPAHYSEVVVPHGTTTIISDPHEIANVLGIEGVEYMHEASYGLPLRHYLLAPSCVPAVPELEGAGAVFGVKEVETLLDLERVIGIGEVMDYPGVLNGSQRMQEILTLALERDVFVQGHAPAVRGRELSAYLCAGIESCHETRIGFNAREKLRNGLVVDARESSMSQNVAGIVKETLQFDSPINLTFCTDDREPKDLIEKGHVSHGIRQAVAEGMDPVRAIRHATLYAAKEVAIKNLGAVAPGYTADFQLLPDLKEFRPTAVFMEGELVAKDGVCIAAIAKQDFAVESRNTMRLKALTVSELQIQAEGRRAKCHVIEYMSMNGARTQLAEEWVPIRDGVLDLSQTDLYYVAIVNRHGSGDLAVGLVRGFGLKMGSVGSTVAHDCHNLSLIYRDPEEAVQIAQVLQNCGGGIAYAKDKIVQGVLELPIAGILSAHPGQNVRKEIEIVSSGIRAMGINNQAPHLRAATIALPVIPDVKMSDLGMIDVVKQTFIPIVVEVE
jgi:adenine deaminase